MIVRMSRRANSEAEVGPAAIAIAVVIGLHSGHGPTAATGIEQQSK